MSISAALDEDEATGDEVLLTLDAVLLYENLSAGLRGKEVLDCAVRLFPRVPHFNFAVWRFDVLRTVPPTQPGVISDLDQTGYFKTRKL